MYMYKRVMNILSCKDGRYFKILDTRDINHGLYTVYVSCDDGGEKDVYASINYNKCLTYAQKRCL